MGLRLPVTLFHPHPLLTLIFLGPVKTQWVALAWGLSQASAARRFSHFCWVQTFFTEVLGDREGSPEAAPSLLRFRDGLWGIHQPHEIMCKIYVCVFIFKKLGCHELSQGSLA